jgi:hypothetical protein
VHGSTRHTRPSLLSTLRQSKDECQVEGDHQ